MEEKSKKNAKIIPPFLYILPHVFSSVSMMGAKIAKIDEKR